MNFGRDNYPELRDAVRELCNRFDSAYWQKIDEKRYPEEFVDALTKAGWMSALIPEDYGGSGLSLTEATVIMEEVTRSGGNAGCCHGQMYNMNTLLRHGSPEQKKKLPKIAGGGCACNPWASPSPVPEPIRRRSRPWPSRRRPLRRERAESLDFAPAALELMILLARTSAFDRRRNRRACRFFWWKPKARGSTFARSAIW